MSSRRRRPRTAPPDWQWWLLAAALPLVLAASKLDLDLWYDEAYTLEIFVSQPFLAIATDYSAPNNHLLYSLILRPFYLLCDLEYVLRLPSLAFTTGSLAMVFLLARRCGGRVAGVLATLLLGLNQMFLVHTMQVRGYGLSMFLAAWLGVLAWPIQAGLRWPRAVGITLVGAAFLYVLPTNLLFLVPLAAAAGVAAAVRGRRAGAAGVEIVPWAAAGLVAGLLYLPVLDQLRQAAAGAGPPSAAGVASLAWAVFAAAGRDWLLILPLAVVGGAVGARGSGRQPLAGIALALVIAAPLAGPFLTTALAGVQPFVRNYCPVLPFLAVAVGWGLAQLLAALGGPLRRIRTEGARAWAGGLVVALVALPYLLSYPARLARYRRDHAAQDGYFNYYAANFRPSEVALFLRQTIDPARPYRICFTDAEHFPLWFYLRREGVPLASPDAGSSLLGTVVYLITPPRPDYPALADKSGLPVQTLRAFPLLKDFGYFRVYRSVPPDEEKPRRWFPPRRGMVRFDRHFPEPTLARVVVGAWGPGEGDREAPAGPPGEYGGAGS